MDKITHQVRAEHWAKIMNECINSGMSKTAGGMLWFYNNEDTKQMVNELDIKAKLNKRKVYSMDKNGNIEYFNSIAEASRKTGINNINRTLKNKTIAGNRQWFYTE